MEDKPHIIQKVQADLMLHSDENHSEKSDRLRRAVQDAMRNLTPILDDLAGESHFRIDSLTVEIDIPIGDFAQLDKKIEDAVRDKIENLFKSQEEAAETVSKETVQQLSEENSYREIIISFLETGRFPWWAENEAFEEVEMWLMDIKNDEWISLIKPLAQNHPFAVNRLVRQFSPSIVQEMVRKTVEVRPGVSELLNFQDEILRFLKTQNVSKTFNDELQKDFISKILRGSIAGKNQEQLVHDLLRLVIKSLTRREGQSEDPQKIVTALREWLKNSEHKEKVSWIERLDNLSSKEGWGVELNDVDESLTVEDFPKEPQENIKKEYVDHKEGVVVINAGVVILHPFLDSLFKNLGYFENGEFMNEAARERAVCLVHYLATGQMEFPEYELMLPKFLCRWPKDLPVNRFLQLTETEIEECRSVLSSCIKHWEALKNTTIDGLRENFLQRDGILKREEFGWSIYIEEKTIDILLEKLPWNLSIIKLKWMDDMLTVHWH